MNEDVVNEDALDMLLEKYNVSNEFFHHPKISIPIHNSLKCLVENTEQSNYSFNNSKNCKYQSKVFQFFDDENFEVPLQAKLMRLKLPNIPHQSKDNDLESEQSQSENGFGYKENENEMFVNKVNKDVTKLVCKSPRQMKKYSVHFDKAPLHYPRKKPKECSAMLKDQPLEKATVIEPVDSTSHSNKYNDNNEKVELENNARDSDLKIRKYKDLPEKNVKKPTEFEELPQLPSNPIFSFGQSLAKTKTPPQTSTSSFSPITQPSYMKNAMSGNKKKKIDESRYTKMTPEELKATYAKMIEEQENLRNLLNKRPAGGYVTDQFRRQRIKQESQLEELEPEIAVVRKIMRKISAR